MREHCMYEKFLIKKGESGIGVILVVSMIIIFMLLPIFTLSFEQALLRIAYQDISDTLELGVFEVFQKVSLKDLSVGAVVVKNSFKESLNDYLKSSFEHPQIETIAVDQVRVQKRQHYEVTFNVQMSLKPTLYRSFWQIEDEHIFTYTIILPMDKKE